MKRSVFLFIIITLLFSCTTTEKRTSNSKIPPQTSPAKNKVIDTFRGSPPTPPVEPEPVVVQEEIPPLRGQVTVSVTNAPLSVVLKGIAESAGLNLVLEKGVDPQSPVTVNLERVSIKDAIDTIISATDYFYKIKNNILFIKALKTEVFEFGHINVVNSYSVDVGGDILGTGEAAGNIKGNISLSGKTATKGSDLWASIDENIKKILSSEPLRSGLKPSYSINRMTGPIVVTATKPLLAKVKKYLDIVKKVLNRQVIIEARIVEVSLSESQKYGIDWSAISKHLSVTTQNFTNVVSNTGPNLEIQVLYTDFTSLIRALEESGNVNVLSNPRVSLMNGQTALLTVGRSTSIISKVETTQSTGTTTSGQTTFTVETTNILSGIMLGIAPFVHPDGDVSITITPIISDLVDLKDTEVGSVGTNYIKLSIPTIDLRQMSTTVRVHDGEMVVIGGLISSRNKTKENKVPVLGSIPLLGWLFKSYEKTKERTELVIMLKPKVLSR